MLNWIKVTEKLPPPDKDVFICVKNKNKSDGIWLYDICCHDGDKWLKRINTWEEILYWAYPTPPKENYV